METINKKHESITSNRRVDLAAYFKMESYKSVYFSAGAVYKFGLTGVYIHFQNDEDKWYFYCNDDTDGFKLLNRPGKTAKIICDASLVSLIKKRTRCGIGAKFLINATNAKLKDNNIMEIDFKKAIDDNY